jgi:hypothetical protein
MTIFKEQKFQESQPVYIYIYMTIFKEQKFQEFQPVHVH